MTAAPAVAEPVREAWCVHTAALMAWFAEQAYADAPAILAAVKPQGFALAANVDLDSLQAELLVGPAAAVLAFRGTANLADWNFDLCAGRVPYAGRKGVGIHGGFWRAWLALEPEVRDAVDAHVPDDLPLYITGHSLGGALAQIAAAELERDNLAACYTFGSPRVATLGFDEAVKCPHYRVVDRWDLVPAVPPASPWGYLHSGDPRLLDQRHPECALRRDRDLVARTVVDAWSLLLWPLTRRISSIDDHMIWNYRARLEAIAAAETLA